MNKLIESMTPSELDPADLLWLISEVKRLRQINDKLVNALQSVLDYKELEDSGIRYTSGAGLTWTDIAANVRAVLRESVKIL